MLKFLRITFFSLTTNWAANGRKLPSTDISTRCLVSCTGLQYSCYGLVIHVLSISPISCLYSRDGRCFFISCCWGNVPRTTTSRKDHPVKYFSQIPLFMALLLLLWAPCSPLLFVHRQSSPPCLSLHQACWKFMAESWSKTYDCDLPLSHGREDIYRLFAVTW